jgi:hypothetical protein
VIVESLFRIRGSGFLCKEIEQVSIP